VIAKGRTRTTVVALTIAALLVCLASAIILSVKWPSDWNALVASLLLGTLTTLIGVFVAVLMAIFVVERYLEDRRREAERISRVEKERYGAMWQAYLHGGVSILSALITHMSLFVAYGKNRYLELMQAEGDTAEVPNTIGAFAAWLPGAVDDGRRQKRAASSRSGGMGDEAALRFVKAFQTEQPVEQSCEREDLEVLLHYLDLYQRHLADQIFLFQPFMNTKMGIALGLVKLSRSLTFSIDDVRRCLSVAKLTAKPVYLDSRTLSNLCDLGLQAVRLAQIMRADDDIKEIIGTSSAS